MAIDYAGFAIPKGTPRKRLKSQLKRQEAAVIKVVRAEVEQRDGYCRINDSACGGRSEWAHLEHDRRFKTRGQIPELRHTTAGTAMLCAAHHRRYDARQIRVRFLTGRGADGPLEWDLR